MTGVEPLRSEHGFSLVGDLDLSSVDAVRQALEPKLHGELVLDVARVEFIDDSGLALLLQVHKQLREQDGALILRHPSPQILRALEMTGVARTPGLILERRDDESYDRGLAVTASDHLEGGSWLRFRVRLSEAMWESELFAPRWTEAVAFVVVGVPTALAVEAFSSWFEVLDSVPLFGAVALLYLVLVWLVRNEILRMWFTFMIRTVGDPPGTPEDQVGFLSDDAVGHPGLSRKWFGEASGRLARRAVRIGRGRFDERPGTVEPLDSEPGLRLGGDLTSPVTAKVERQWSLGYEGGVVLDKHVVEYERGLLLDLRGVEYVDLLGLRFLRETHERLREHGGFLILRGPRGQVLRALKGTGVTQVPGLVVEPVADPPGSQRAHQ